MNNLKIGDKVKSEEYNEIGILIAIEGAQEAQIDVNTDKGRIPSIIYCNIHKCTRL